MSLVPAICTQCGAQIEVDNAHEAGICKHCGTAFITEKAINNYITTNKIYANTVNVWGNSSSDFVIRAGVLEKYNGESTNVVIPNSVMTIGNNAFSECIELSSVEIPNSVTAIGQRAFFSCKNLRDIVLPNNLVSIEHDAFYGCVNLKNINIPNSVTSIGWRAFGSCVNLSNITLPDGIMTIELGVFEGCKSLTKISLPSSVTSIRDAAFRNCENLINIKLPNGIKSISDELFMGCKNLTKITIPYGVNTIGYKAFMGCEKLTTIVIPDSVKEIHMGYDYYPISPLPNNPLLNIVASEEWKTEHYNIADCLEKYKPAPPSKFCYVATCIYGSYDCPQVWTLRRFRDNTLDVTWYGRLFIKCYYAISPTLVKWFGEQKWFRTFWKNRLDKMVSKLNKQGVEDTEYSDKF